VAGHSCIATLRVIVLVLVAGLAACGSDGSSNRVVVRVGNAQIRSAAVSHWISVMAAGLPSSASAPERHQELKRRALEFLISSEWSIGEAASRGLAISEREIHRRLAEQQAASFPGGQAERSAFAKATGESTSDLELQVRAELASSRLAAMAADGARPVTRAAIVDYYDRERRRFLTPELREVRITNRKTRADAERLKRAIESGADFAARSERLRISLPGGARARQGTPLERAIRASRRGVLTGPVKQRVDYFVFELKRIVPANSRALSQVAGSIGRRLREAGRRHALAESVSAWRAKWRARTDCRAGYVVQGCRQYDGPKAPEDSLRFN
jgi:foldase protein PrsA